MLPYYLIICRSLTYAQRTVFVLERVGVPSSIQRAPKVIAEEGCSHAVRVPQRHLTRALTALRQAELAPARVFLHGEEGYREVLV